MNGDGGSTTTSQIEMNTAIEEEAPRRWPNWWRRRWATAESVLLAMFSEIAMTFYVLIHWLLAGGAQILYGNYDSSAFVCFLYFMATLLAFLSIMSNISTLLVPLFVYCGTSGFTLLFLFHLSILNVPGARGLFETVCKDDAISMFCDAVKQNDVVTAVKCYSLILLCMLTCVTIFFQVDRNEEYARRQHLLPRVPWVYPPLAQRETPVGAINVDEPPRYSTLEPLESSKQAAPNTTAPASTMTSPPRYSYWERTFGARRSPQVSTAIEPESNNNA
ncbi:unnamed protein product [Caenorhabditis sp. 36 PRJEB53466]|nr:unnamed protein product [Caenorhabditis sp. 36 PRJEB53466]